MKMHIESSEPPKPPSIFLQEKDTDRGVEKLGSKDRISELDIPIDTYSMKLRDYDDLLIKVRREILGEGESISEIMNKLVKAIEEKTEDGKVWKFAVIENLLVKKCVNLKESDIDSTIEQLGRKFLKLIREGKIRSNILSDRTMEQMAIGRFNIISIGVKSVIRFLRERFRLLMEKPEQQFIIGFNNRLDASQKIDIIEIIFGNDANIIEKLSFIQIKSSVPTDEVIKDIVSKHREFVHKGILSVKDAIASDMIGEQILIKSVDSILTVGPNIINQVEIYNSRTDDEGELIAIRA